MRLVFQKMCVASTDVFQSYQKTQSLFFLTGIGVSKNVCKTGLSDHERSHKLSGENIGCTKESCEINFFCENIIYWVSYKNQTYIENLIFLTDPNVFNENRKSKELRSPSN